MNRKTDDFQYQNSIAVAILAGGLGSRMGGCLKGKICLDGRYVLDIMLEKMKPLGIPVCLIVKNTTEYAEWGIPKYQDLLEYRSPLVGIHAALKSRLAESVLVVAVDLPGLDVNFLKYMIDQRKSGDIIIPKWNERFEPLCAIYHSKLAEKIEDLTRRSRLKPIDLLADSAVRIITEREIHKISNPEYLFKNLNTEQDILDWYVLKRNSMNDEDVF